MATLVVNPLSYLDGRTLTFQFKRTVKRLTLTGQIRSLLGKFLSLPYITPLSREANTLNVDVEPLVKAGILVAADGIERFLLTERTVLLSQQDDGNLIYLLLAATRAGIRWWLVHDGLAPLVLFARASSRSNTSPGAAYLFDQYFLGEPTQLPSITTTKAVANQLCGAWGLAAPRQVYVPASVLDRVGASPRASRDAADWVGLHWNQRFDFPLILKPAAQSVSRGVMLVHDEPALGAALGRLYRKFGQAVVVERCIRGPEWRVLMLANGRYAAYRRIHPSVHGDGRSTVRALIEQRHRERAERFRLREYLRRPNRPPLAGLITETLAEQELTLDTVARRGRRMVLSLTQTAAIENTSADATALLSPAKRRVLLDFVHRVGATRLGFDLMGGPIGRGPFPHILEVNSRPFVVRHEEPDIGRPQPAARMILDYFLDRGLSDAQLARIARRLQPSGRQASL